MDRFLCLFMIVILLPLGPVPVLNAKPIGMGLDILESTGNNTHWDDASILTEHLARITYVNNIIKMAGVILFGPEKAHSTLRSKLLKLEDHDRQCLESTYKLFLKHCGEIESDSINRLRSFGNMCSFVADKAKIEDAFIISCGTNNSEPSVIDKANPSIEVIAAPVPGSSDYYCGRVSVKGISRMKPWSYGKEYRVRVSPSPIVRDESYSKIHLCFHRNATLGLCQCEKDDWISVKERSRSSRMSPYEHSFVDVKVESGAFGDVMVIYDEVSRRGRYELLFGGTGLLFLAPIASKEFFPRVASRGAQFSKWCMLILGVTCILHSSFDTPLAIVAAASCLAVYYVISSIIWRDDDPPIFSKTINIWPSTRQTTLEVGEGGIHGFIDCGCDDWYYSTDIEGSRHQFYSSFHKIPNRKKLSKKEWEEVTDEWTRKSVGELISSSKFKDWVIGKHWVQREVARRDNWLDGE